MPEARSSAESLLLSVELLWDRIPSSLQVLDPAYLHCTASTVSHGSLHTCSRHDSQLLAD